MRFNGLNNLVMALPFLLAASGAQANVLGVSSDAVGAQYASLGMVSSTSVSFMQGAGSYIDGASIMNAYYNVSGGGMLGAAGSNPWDSALSWLDGFSNLGPLDIQLPAVAAPVAAAPAPAPAAPAPAPVPAADSMPAAAPVPAADSMPGAAPVPVVDRMPPAAPVVAGGAGESGSTPPAATIPASLIIPDMPDMPGILLPADPGAQAVELPEPASFILFGLGLAGLLATRRRAS